MVVAVQMKRWRQTVEDLRVLALTSEHPRTRERFLALHDIAIGSNATQVAARTGRCDETILRWLHTYNEQGPDALSYQHTGGHRKFARRSKPRSTKRSAKPSRAQRRRR
jgi:transposase